jgi:hypothetical protein
MFSENQPVHVVRQLRRHSEFAEKFAFGWRSALNLCIKTGISGIQWNKTVSPQPQSGVRMQPTAQAVGKTGTMLAPAGRKISSHLPTQIDSARDEQTVPPRPPGRCFSLLRATDAAALIEFAVALPLLVVLVVGIFDFGGAFNLKQELSNAVREGARFAAAQPSNDISPNILKPPSVDAIRFLVDSYLQTAHINDCGLSAVPEPASGGGLSWVYTASTGCPGGGALTLTISRGVLVPITPSGATVNMVCSTVSIVYPYQWHFNSVIQLLVPGANYTLTNLSTSSTAVNMD